VARRRRAPHWLFIVLNLAVVALIAGAIALVAALVAPWAWPLIGLPVLYTVGAVLYSLESKLRLPGWLAQSIEVSATIWPPIKWLATSEQVRAANGALVESFNRTLHEYDLEPLSNALSADLAEFARPLRVRALAAEWREERERAKEEAPDAPGVDEVVPGVDALELLHRERCGESTFSLWQAEKEKEKEKDGAVDELAPVVGRGERLPKPDPSYPFSDADIRELLAALRDFDIELLADELRAVNRLGGRLQRYAQFACAYPKQALERKGGIVSLIKTHGDGLPTGRSTLFRLDGTAEILTLMEVIEDCNDPTRGPVHRGIFLAERDIDPGGLKERACADALRQRHADDKTGPVGVLQAYLWEKYRRGAVAIPLRATVQQITSDELDSKWTDWSDDAEKTLEAGKTGAFWTDLGSLKERLEAGIWPTGRGAPGEAEPKEAESGEAEPYPIPLPVVVPEHDEIRDLDAYLITFDDRVGPIAEIVDGLRQRDPDYRFGPYTRNTRLGILPRGVPFHEFIEKLFSDLDRTLHERFGRSKDLESKLDKLEVTVNRVDLAHCRELWFGDPKLAEALRSPSIDDVLAEIIPLLAEEERPPVKAAFDHVAGGHHGNPQSSSN
jgi:hypothetical protein